jgi:hypothetical protein
VNPVKAEGAAVPPEVAEAMVSTAVMLILYSKYNQEGQKLVGLRGFVSRTLWVFDNEGLR